MTSFQSVDIIKLSGSDCFNFLNNQTISKVQATEDRVCHYSAICNPKGRVLFSLFIFTESNNINLAVCSELSSELLTFLNMRRFRMDVQIEQVNSLALGLISGKPENNYYPLDLIEKDDNPTEEIWPTTFKWQLPWIEKAYQEKYIPQHLSMDLVGAIDFKKGCYPGQEIIARLHYLGEVKKRLKLLEVKAANKNVTKNDITEKLLWCSDAQLIEGKWLRQAVVNILK